MGEVMTWQLNLLLLLRKFYSQHLHGNLQLQVTPAPEDVMPFVACVATVCTYACAAQVCMQN